MKPVPPLIRHLLAAGLAVFAVGVVEGATGQDIIPKQTDFTVPASPAFTLLGVTPEQVNQPGYLRDFKIDWVIKDGGGLAPNIAIDAQPVWLAFFGHTTAAEYRTLPWFARMASTLSASLGSVQNGSSDSGTVAWGARLNLFRQADPLMSETYVDLMRPVFSDAEEHILNPLRIKLENQLVDSLHMKKGVKDSLKGELERVEREITELSDAEEQRRQDCRSTYEQDHWNAACVDIGGGMLGDYSGSSPESLRFTYAGMGLWTNGCVPIGKTLMLTAMYRFSERRDSLHHSLGLGLRYGGPRLSGFFEVVDGLDDLGVPSIGYGGDYRLTDNLLIQVGSRTALKSGVTLASFFRPRVKLSVITR